MSDFSVTGADQFLKLSKALKAAGRTEMRKQLNKGMRTAAKPLIPIARAAFIAGLPHGGGAGEFVAAKRMRAATHTGRDPGVSIVVAKEDPRLDSEGRLVHPVFNRKRADGKRVTVVQQVTPHIFSDAMSKEAPQIRGALEAAIEAVADQIVKEAK